MCPSTFLGYCRLWCKLWRHCKIELQFKKYVAIWKRKTNSVCQTDDSRRHFMASHEALPDWLFETHPLFCTCPVLNELWPANTVQRAHSQSHGNRTEKKYTQSLKHKQQSYQMSLYFMFSVQKRTDWCFYLNIWVLFKDLRREYIGKVVCLYCDLVMCACEVE